MQHRVNATAVNATAVRRGLMAAAIALVLASPAWAGDVVCDPELDSTAAGADAVACGRENIASGANAVAFGAENESSGGASSALGFRNFAGGTNSAAIGHRNYVTGLDASAVGSHNLAEGQQSSAFGSHNRATGPYSAAFGVENAATGHASVAFGVLNAVTGDQAVGVGYGINVGGRFSAGFGNGVLIYTGAENAIALGAAGDAPSYTRILNNSGRSVAIGYTTLVEADSPNAIALGAWANARGADAIAIGRGAYSGGGGLAIGKFAATFAANSVAIGENAEVGGTGVGSVAIGANAIADRAGVVSFGTSGQERQLVNVAAGTQPTDAVNVAQLNQLGDGIAAWLGGGAAYVNGTFTAPSYAIQGANYSNVGDALAAVDGKLTEIDGRTGGGGGVSEQQVRDIATQGDAQTLASARDYADAGDAQTLQAANDYTDERIATVVGGAVEIAHDYADAREAAVRTDMAAADAKTLAEAKTYADAGDAATLTAANAYTDNAIEALTGIDYDSFKGRLDALEDSFAGLDERMNQQDRRIARQGAMGAAMLNMAINAAGTQSPRGRVAVGAGFQGSERALSVGYGKRIGKSASFSLGGAFSGSERSAGMGFGVDL